MLVSKEKQGELFIFGEAVLWSLFPVLTILSYSKVAPMVSLGGSAVFASVFFAILLTVKRKWKELKHPEGLKDAFLTMLISGIAYYVLYFFGLVYTSAGNASIIALTGIFFNYLFFQIWRRELFPLKHLLGAVLMIVGTLIVLYPKMGEFRGGELLILLAASIVPIGNFFQKRARTKISSESIMFVRSIGTAVVILALALILHDNFHYDDIKGSLWFFAINGFLLLGLSRILWIEGIHRITITKASALESTAPLFTLFFAWILLNNKPTMWQILAFIPMFLGVILLGTARKKLK
ncbi:DMT family transporter [Candidatus Daviesbacteria bacterium]|nr:DMT family transporter [Candidatus Daviesbacteria bacterium]